jgi:nicotinamidase-related amidase
MSEATVQKPVVIILDMAKGYHWTPGSSGYDMVARVRRLKDAAHAARVSVIHVHSMRRPTDGRPSEMMVNTEALDLIPELEPHDRDVIMYKRFRSGFSYNDLDYTLRTMGCDCVLIAGASTDNTVLFTAADAAECRYKPVVVEDCTMVHREVDRQVSHEGALRIIRHVVGGDVISLDEAIATYLKPA